jgi:hypothetical protein
MSMTTSWLLHLYPAAWRERYGDEFAALLDDCRLSPLNLLDVLRGALDAHLHAEVLTGRLLPMLDRLRRAEIAVFCAWVAFVVAGLGFQKMTEYDDFMEATRAHPLIGISFTAIQAGSIVVLLAVLVGGLPLALAALRYALAGRRFDVALLFAVPLAAFATLAAYLFVALHVANGAGASHRGPTAHDRVLAIGLIAVLILGAVASPWAVSAAISRSQVAERWYRFARIPALVTMLAMAVMCVADIVWGLALRAEAPHLFAGNGGVLATSTALSWLRDAGVMVIATVVAVIAVCRGLAPREPGATPANAQSVAS